MAKKLRKLNCNQLHALRHANPVHGYISCDRSTGKALVVRGFACTYGDAFYITPAGRERAKFRADMCEAHQHSGRPLSFYAALLQDLPDTSAWKPKAEVVAGIDAYLVKYEVVKGKPQLMQLDAQDRDSALLEAAALTGLPESEITYSEE